ncbi:MAG: bifunctional lysylphosphatidylglycerol flippase/synthetase MprF [Vicinamibacterales bacterium]
MTAGRVRSALRQAAPVAIGVVLFGVALEVLRSELRSVTWHELSATVWQTPPSRLLLAAFLTAVNYLALSGYDLLAFAYIGKALSRVRIAAASMLAYAISNNVGFAMLSGASVRYRLYSRWGVTAEELSRIVVSYSVTFWLGLCGLGGLSLLLSPPVSIVGAPALRWLQTAGAILLLAPPAYLAATLVRRLPLTVGGFELPMPSPRIAAGQIVVSTVDWALAGGVLYALLPPGRPPFLPFSGAFLVAVLLGMASHVPGGVGVFEGLMVVLLGPWLESAAVLPALAVYRAVYYLAPLSVALVTLVGDELWQRRTHVRRAGASLGRLAERLTPRALAAFAFLAGLVLLLSGATPAAAGRLALLDRLFPLGVIEASHFLASIAGALLLLLSQGLARRLDAAYYLSAATLGVGVAASLLKGGDYEEATLLAGTLLLLWRARPAFDRRAALLDTRFPAGWVAAVVGAVAASVWLGFFAFKHVDYATDLWWQFELRGDASRFLRASVGVAVVFLLAAFARLIGHAPHDAPPPTARDLEDAARAIAAQSSTTPNLAFLGDKSLLFNDARTGFVMYAVQGRTWVAMGDPVGAPAEVPGLVRRFLERCDDFGGVPVFYEVGPAFMHAYADAGLTFAKLGEAARVNLASFTLEGGAGYRHRQSVRRLEKEGATFRIVPPAEVAPLLPELRAVSDDWLQSKAAAEKGFSLGFFDEAYLARFPVAVVERQGRIEAFANLWTSADRSEVSIDLMRYRHDAFKGVMEALFVALMRWARQEGYRWFALGMAPLSGVEASPVASIWQRLASFLYEHGEAVYNFQGLRAYKDKFEPVWEPHYLAYPGGLRLARIMADVTALVAGGYRQIFRK